LIAVLVPSAIALEIFSRLHTKQKYIAKRKYYKFRIPNRYAKNEFKYQTELQINNSYKESGLKSHFDFLGIGENATSKEIKTARDKMILSWHPDKNKHTAADQMIQRINHSYKTLKQAGKC
jgi:DnaJ-class molecular chaperone